MAARLPAGMHALTDCTVFLCDATGFNVCTVMPLAV